MSLRLRTSLALLALAAFGPAQIRVATWNVSNYSGGRVADLQNAIYGVFANGTGAQTTNKTSFRPDALMVQEVTSQAAQDAFLAALNSAPGGYDDWVAAPFTNGADTDNAFFYRSSKMTFLRGDTIATGSSASNDQPRDTDRYLVQLKGYEINQPKLALYSVHLKAGGGSSDETRRNVETTRIRTDAQSLGATFGNDTAFMIGGDFNVPSASDRSYVTLTGSQSNNAGRFFDPISQGGKWQDDASRPWIHTQDPQKPNGQGGMDDRYDFLLTSGNLVDGQGFDYVGQYGTPYGPQNGSTWNDPRHSYTVWGNDGTSLNEVLRTAGNTMVGESMAQSLRNMATSSGGHLPVFLDLRAPGEIQTSTNLLDFGTVDLNASVSRTLDVFNGVDTSILGDDVASILYSFSVSEGFSAPEGLFSDAIGGGVNRHLFTFNGASTIGTYTGTLTISSNDPFVRARTILFRVQTVPEPASLAVLGLGALALLRRRRRN